jgi:uncharacterized protein
MMDAHLREKLIAQTARAVETQDWPYIESLWQPHVELGDTDAVFQLAYHYLFFGFDEGLDKDEEMLRLLGSAATRGHPDATYWYAIRQTALKPEERDLLLQTAANLGSAPAQRHVGALFATGDWTGPKDLQAAILWYGRAAAQNHAEAQYNLGFMYLLGEGTQQDIPRALQLLHLSADQGDKEAVSLLADIYRSGYCGGPIDERKAREMEQKL